MSDIYSREKRSQVMARIKSLGTKPEAIVRKALFALGYRFRKNDVRLPGKPDIVLAKYKVAVFVNGCFWHRHEGCRYNRMPKSNTTYWVRKFDRNLQRDLENVGELEKSGWRVYVIWECQIEDNLDNVISNLSSFLQRT